jgi:hypothetical protein
MWYYISGPRAAPKAAPPPTLKEKLRRALAGAGPPARPGAPGIARVDTVVSTENDSSDNNFSA